MYITTTTTITSNIIVRRLHPSPRQATSRSRAEQNRV